MKKIFLIAGITIAFVIAWKRGILPNLNNKKTLNDFRIPVDQAIISNLQSVINK